MTAHLPLVVALVTAHAPFLDDPLQVITDPPAWVQSWLWGAVFGKDQVQGAGWLGDLFARAFYFTGFDTPVGCGQGGGNCTYFAVWSALQASGYLVLALVLMFRLFKVLFDPRKQHNVAQWLVADVLIRGSLATLAINVSYIGLAQLMHGSIDIGDSLFENIVSVAGTNFGGQAGIQHALAVIMNNVAPIPALIESAVILYLTVLLVASRVAMIFAIAVAPLLIPLYAYSGDNSLITWWMRLVGQGLLVPIVTGALFGVALIVIMAVQSTPGGLITPIFDAVTTVAVFWFVGHAIHELLRYLFPGHRGFFAGFALWHERTGRVRSVASDAGRAARSIVP